MKKLRDAKKIANAYMPKQNDEKSFFGDSCLLYFVDILCVNVIKLVASLYDLLMIL